MQLGRAIDSAPEPADPHRMEATAADLLARNLRAERSRRRWRQADLAQALGWSPTKVADAEAGRRRLDIDQIIELCRVLNVPLSKLLDGADPENLQVLGL
jgi:transcriptional regulator with XRE-family HTH domain